jgi:hypothetical protein
VHTGTAEYLAGIGENGETAVGAAQLAKTLAVLPSPPAIRKYCGSFESNIATNLLKQGNNPKSTVKTPFTAASEDG